MNHLQQTYLGRLLKILKATRDEKGKITLIVISKRNILI